MPSDVPGPSTPPSTPRLVLRLSAALVLGGGGIAYIWSTLNALAEGQASAGRLLLTVPVALLVALVLFRLYRLLSRLAAHEERRAQSDGDHRFEARAAPTRGPREEG